MQIVEFEAWTDAEERHQTQSSFDVWEISPGDDTFLGWYAVFGLESRLEMSEAMV